MTRTVSGLRGREHPLDVAACRRGRARRAAGAGSGAGRRRRSRRPARPASRAARAAGCGRERPAPTISVRRPVARRSSAVRARNERALAEARRADQRPRRRARRATKMLRGKSPTVRRRARRSRTRPPPRPRPPPTIASRLARAGVAPDPLVEAEDDEREVARDQDRRQRDGEHVPLVRACRRPARAGGRRRGTRPRSARSRPAPRAAVAGAGRSSAASSRRRTTSSPALALEVDEEARELHEQRRR